MSSLEDNLAFQLDASGIQYNREVVMVPGRKYRWDFMIDNGTGDPILIEIQGGVWKKSGHTTGGGITRDCEKANLATLNGYRTLFFTAEMVRDGSALKTIEEAMKWL